MCISDFSPIWQEYLLYELHPPSTLKFLRGHIALQVLFLCMFRQLSLPGTVMHSYLRHGLIFYNFFLVMDCYYHKPHSVQITEKKIKQHSHLIKNVLI